MSATAESSVKDEENNELWQCLEVPILAPGFHLPLFSLRMRNNMSSLLPISAKKFGGILLKYTNVVKGWQNRYFSVDPAKKRLYYYMLDEMKRSEKGSPRGVIELNGAVIAPSEEDSVSFSVITSNGNSFKLRASDAKERHTWVDRIRRAAGLTGDKTMLLPKTLKEGSDSQSSSTVTLTRSPPSALTLLSTEKCSDEEQSNIINQVLFHADECHRELIDVIEKLPNNGILPYIDKEILTLKATSIAALVTLHDCASLMKRTRKQSTVTNLPPSLRFYKTFSERVAHLS